jgi:hypothetical protein
MVELVVELVVSLCITCSSIPWTPMMVRNMILNRGVSASLIAWRTWIAWRDLEDIWRISGGYLEDLEYHLKIP